MEASYAEWVRRWQAALDACQRMGGEAHEMAILPPASEEDIAQVEAEIGRVLPTSFRKVLTEFSGHLSLDWYLPDNVVLPQELREIFSGECSWGLPQLREAIKNYHGWLETNFADVEDSYDSVWHNKLAFAQVANGDLLAFDLKFVPDPPVVYLSHDGGDGHGYRLGDNFIDFIDRWSLLGCPGSEDWQMMPFLPNATGGLDPYGENARKWREWFGLDFEVTP